MRVNQSRTHQAIREHSSYFAFYDMTLPLVDMDLHAAVMLCKLLNREDYERSKDPSVTFFVVNYADWEKIGLSVFQVRACRKKLVEKGFILHRLGANSEQQFRINHSALQVAVYDRYRGSAAEVGDVTVEDLDRGVRNSHPSPQSWGEEGCEKLSPGVEDTSHGGVRNSHPYKDYKNSNTKNPPTPQGGDGVCSPAGVDPDDLPDGWGMPADVGWQKKSPPSMLGGYEGGFTENKEQADFPESEAPADLFSRLDAPSTARTGALSERDNAVRKEQVVSHVASGNANKRSKISEGAQNTSRGRRSGRNERPEYSGDFENFWKTYPRRLCNGEKGSKLNAWQQWGRLSEEDQAAVLAGVRQLRADYNAALQSAGINPNTVRFPVSGSQIFFPIVDAERFISQRRFESYAERVAETPAWQKGASPYVRDYFRWDAAEAELRNQGETEEFIADCKAAFDEDGWLPVFMHSEYRAEEARKAAVEAGEMPEG